MAGGPRLPSMGKPMATPPDVLRIGNLGGSGSTDFGVITCTVTSSLTPGYVSWQGEARRVARLLMACRIQSSSPSSSSCWSGTWFLRIRVGTSASTSSWEQRSLSWPESSLSSRSAGDDSGRTSPLGPDYLRALVRPHASPFPTWRRCPGSRSQPLRDAQYHPARWHPCSCLGARSKTVDSS